MNVLRKAPSRCTCSEWSCLAPVVHKSLWGHINRQANKPGCLLTSNRVASVKKNGRQEIEKSQHSEI